MDKSSRLQKKFYCSLYRWLHNGWNVVAAYIIGFGVLFLINGWQPAENKKHRIINCLVKDCLFSRINKKIDFKNN